MTLYSAGFLAIALFFIPYIRLGFQREAEQLK